MSVRAKFVVNSYETSLQQGVELRSIKLQAVYQGSEENKQFFRLTPNGTISIGLLNPETWAQFHLGASLYVDFSPAED